MIHANKNILIASISVGILLIAIVVTFLIKKFMYKSFLINPTAKKYRITSPFGRRTSPTTGASTNHNGIDIATPMRTPILAPADGTIGYVVTNDAGGLQVAIDIKDHDLRVGFAHLDEATVRNGQLVHKGDIIAYTGNSGRSTGPHLHLTVKDSFGMQNPTKYFSY
ncbi:MAG: M23 family metallopeptidase [Paludibacteraceae bacterium]|nr:M23 family metallopeptidase [Paludibacteraceae bacterium]